MAVAFGTGEPSFLQSREKVNISRLFELEGPPSQPCSQEDVEEKAAAFLACVLPKVDADPWLNHLNKGGKSLSRT